LSLSFEQKRFRVRRQDPPWKVVRAFALQNSGALIHLNNISGGVLAGDRLALDVDVRDGARAQITTTGATRLYRHRAGAPESEQYMRFVVGDAAELEYLPEPTIPYAGSRHTQRTEIQLGRKATLFWWETVAPGRLAAGERFAFERLRVQAKIDVRSRPVLREDFLLEPGRRSLSSAVQMFRYSYVVSFYAVQEGRPASFWRAIEDRLGEIARSRTQPEQAVWGASMLASDGVVVRGLSVGSCLIQETLLQFWRAARLALTGKEAVPPRKVY
jgi:urease accessory protein